MSTDNKLNFKNITKMKVLKSVLRCIFFGETKINYFFSFTEINNMVRIL